jgi:hypothetical protein
MRCGYRSIAAMSANLSGSLSERRGRKSLNEQCKAIGARRQMQAARVGTHTGATPLFVPLARPARQARGRRSLPCVSLRSLIFFSAAPHTSRPVVFPADLPGRKEGACRRSNHNQK